MGDTPTHPHLQGCKLREDRGLLCLHFISAMPCTEAGSNRPSRSRYVCVCV